MCHIQYVGICVLFVLCNTHPPETSNTSVHVYGAHVNNLKLKKTIFLTMLFVYYSLYSSEGSTVIPLNGSCNSSTTPFQNFTTTPPSFTSTSLSNATLNTTVNSSVTLVSTFVNVTTSSANVTTSGN